MSRARTLPLLALLLLIAATGVLWGAFSTRESQRLSDARDRLEAQLGTLDLARLAPATLPPTSNAAAMLVRATEHEPTPSRAAPEAAGRIGRDVLTPLDAAERDQLAAFVGAHSQMLSLARRAVAAEGSSFEIDYSAGARAEMPDFSRLLRLGKLLLVEARLSLDEGNFVLAEANLATLHTLRMALANESILISQMVAMTIDRYFLEAVQLFLRASEPDPAVLKLAIERLDQRQIVGGLRRGLAGEALMAADRSKAAGGEPARLERIGRERLDANMLEDYLGWIERGELERDELEAELERRTGTASADRGPLYVTYPELLLKALALETSSRLARSALELAGSGVAIASARESLETDRFSGRAPVLAAAADGSTELVLQPAEEIWSRHHADRSEPAPRFRWRVAAVPAADDTAAPDELLSLDPPRAG